MNLQKNIFTQLSGTSRTVLTTASAFVIAEQFSRGKEASLRKNSVVDPNQQEAGSKSVLRSSTKVLRSSTKCKALFVQNNFKLCFYFVKHQKRGALISERRYFNGAPQTFGGGSWPKLPPRGSATGRDLQYFVHADMCVLSIAASCSLPSRASDQWRTQKILMGGFWFRVIWWSYVFGVRCL